MAKKKARKSKKAKEAKKPQEAKKQQAAKKSKAPADAFKLPSAITFAIGRTTDVLISAARLAQMGHVNEADLVRAGMQCGVFEAWLQSRKRAMYLYYLSPTHLCEFVDWVEYSTPAPPSEGRICLMEELDRMVGEVAHNTNRASHWEAAVIAALAVEAALCLAYLDGGAADRDQLAFRQALQVMALTPSEYRGARHMMSRLIF